MLRFLEAVIGKVLAGNIQLESEHRDISSFRSPTSTGKAHSSTQWKDVNKLDSGNFWMTSARQRQDKSIVHHITLFFDVFSFSCFLINFLPLNAILASRSLFISIFCLTNVTNHV
ncbi:unnamed protein product [Lepidochelys kempii]